MLTSGKDKVGFTNGCFDILHIGHIRLFEFVREHCDTLVVAIDSDERVKALKGPSRPFNNEDDRSCVLKSLATVDDVLIFNSAQELREIVQAVAPDLMVVGDDYKDREVIGSEYAKELQFFKKIDGYSTTKIIKSSPAG